MEKEKQENTEWKLFSDEKPKEGQFIWLKQDTLQERAIFRNKNDIEIILPSHKNTTLITCPTHWKNDTY